MLHDLSDRFSLLVLIVGTLVIAQTKPAPAAVAVVSNRTQEEVTFSVVEAGPAENPQPTKYKIAPGDLTAVPLPRSVSAKLASDAVNYDIQADAAY